jgi:hypothetical protein
MPPKPNPDKTAAPHRRFADLLERCSDLPSAVVLLEEMAAALEAEQTRRNLQSTLGLFSDWLGEVRWKHAPVDADLYARVLAVLDRVKAVSAEPMLASDAGRLYGDLEALRDA